jgi:hypothetical protein
MRYVLWIILFAFIPEIVLSEWDNEKPDDHVALWVFKLHNKNEYLKISLKDTLIDSIPCIRYQEIYTSSPLGGVDFTCEKESGEAVAFYIPALNENVSVNKEEKMYQIRKFQNEKENHYSIPYDSLTIPSYARYTLPLFQPVQPGSKVELYMFSGKTCPYVIKQAGEDILYINGKERPCDIWNIETQFSSVMGQEDLLWVSKESPRELLKIEATYRMGKIFGISLGKKTAVYERIY